MASPLYGPLSRMLPGAQSPDDALKTFLGMSPTTPDAGVQQAPADDSRVGPTIAVPDSASEPLKYSTNPEKDAAAYDAHNRADYEQKQALVDFFNPQNQQKNQQDFSQKLAIAEGPARVAAQGQMGVEHARAQGAVDLQNAKDENITKRLSQPGMPGAGGGSQNPGGNQWKVSVNAQGVPSYTEQTMPAIVQRSFDQLNTANNRIADSLQEAERLYPGVTAEAQKADTATTSPGVFSLVTGIGAPKYGSLLDKAGAAVDNAKYQMGFANPFSKLAQDQSFGNIEQMAGQLPGVRGIGQLASLFKQHQANFGSQTPLANVQRLLHMQQIMNSTLSDIKSGSQNVPGQTISGDTGDPYADPNYQPK